MKEGFSWEDWTSYIGMCTKIIFPALPEEVGDHLLISLVKACLQFVCTQQIADLFISLCCKYFLVRFGNKVTAVPLVSFLL